MEFEEEQDNCREKLLQAAEELDNKKSLLDEVNLFQRWYFITVREFASDRPFLGLYITPSAPLPLKNGKIYEISLIVSV